MPGSMVERKYNDTTFSATNVSTTGSIGLVFQATQGVGANERVGNKVLLKSVQLTGRFYTENSGDVAVSINTPTQMCRFILLVDKQPNGALPALGDILEASGSVESPIKMANRDRFVVLKDKWVVLGPNNTTASANVISYGGEQIKLVKWFKKVRIPVTYGGSTNGIASINSNALLAVVMGSQAAGENDALFNGYLRVRYQDA